MTTDDMILALVAKHGFRLPNNPHLSKYGSELYFRDDRIARGLCGAGMWCWGGNLSLCMDPQQAHDLCAVDFARQAKQTGIHQYRAARGWMAMAVPLANGDSPAAIKALWEALQ